MDMKIKPLTTLALAATLIIGVSQQQTIAQTDSQTEHQGHSNAQMQHCTDTTDLQHQQMSSEEHQKQMQECTNTNMPQEQDSEAQMQHEQMSPEEHQMHQ